MYTANNFPNLSAPHADMERNNLTVQALVRSYLDSVLEASLLAQTTPGENYDMAFTYEPQAAEEADIAQRGLLFVSDARAQAQMPSGVSANEQAHMFYLNQAAAIGARSNKVKPVVLDDIFTVNPTQNNKRKILQREVRSQVILPASYEKEREMSGISYAALVILREARYPGIVMPDLPNSESGVIIRNKLYKKGI